MGDFLVYSKNAWNLCKVVMKKGKPFGITAKRTKKVVQSQQNDLDIV